MKNILHSSQEKYLDSLRKKDDSLIERMEEFGKKNNVPILNKDAAQFLEQMIFISKPSRVLEIGTAIAYSTIRIARNLNSSATVDTIELSKDNIKLAMKNITDSGLVNKINVIEGDALKVMPMMKTNYDLIFLDADKEDYEELFTYALPILKKDGIIFIDNLLWHGYVASSQVPANYKRSTECIRKFNQMFVDRKDLKTTILPIGDGIGLGIKVN